MEHHYTLLAFIALYMVATILIGYWASKFVKNTNDFVVAGRRMPLIVVASGLFATWFGSETVMGASTAFLKDGIMGIIEDPFGAALCLFFVGIFMARPLYKLNLYTFSDYFLRRFNHTAETLSAVMMVPSYLGWIGAQLIALATILNVITGLPIWIGVLICAAVVMFYTYIGGMWAVSITDFVQTIIIIIGMLVVMFDVLERAGGFSTIMAQTDAKTFQYLPKAHFKDIIAYIAAWITVGLGSVPQQDVFMRVMSAKNEKTAVRGAYLSGFMYLTVGMIPIVIALCGKFLLPEIAASPDDSVREQLIPQMVLQQSSLFVQVMFFGALLSAILSTASGAILAPATVIGENIIKARYKNMTDVQLLLAMRLSVVGVTIASVFFSFLGKNIYELVRQSSEISLVSLFVPLIFGLYWKRANANGAIHSMLWGMGVWLFSEAYQYFYVPNEDDRYPSIVFGLLASILGMVVFSIFSKNKDK